jgi:hypothetical protein
VLPEGPDALLPLGPLALALLPEPVVLLAVAPLLFCVPAEEPPVPRVDAPTPLPAVALPPLPMVLELPVLLPEVPDAVPSVLVVVLLCALRTPVPPSAWRPAAKPLLSVVLVPPVPAVCACKVMAAASAVTLTSRLRVNLTFIVDTPFAVLAVCRSGVFLPTSNGRVCWYRRTHLPFQRR